MVRFLFKLAIVGLIVHAGYRYGIVYLHYQQFKDAVQETALFAKDKDEAEVAARVMELAAQYQIPLDRRYMQVRRHNDTTLIDAVYVEEIEWLPTWKKPMEFVVGTNVRAPSASGIR
jgi:heme oxygenase